MAQQRLQKILARAGLSSRRKAEELIRTGRVAVDGRVVDQPGVKADPARQRITLDGRPLPPPPGRRYWLVHKPRGVVSTARDPQGRPKVTDLLPPEVRSARLYPVGRLDRDSEGLVLLTNDGELAHRLMHPRYQVPKHYRVWVEGRPSAATLECLRRGVDIGEDRPTAPARVYLKSAGRARSKLSILTHEGRKREIRRMCQAVGHPVLRLVRVGLGPLRLGDLPPGAARPLTRSEITALRLAAGLITGCKEAGDRVKRPTRARCSQRPGRAEGDKGR